MTKELKDNPQTYLEFCHELKNNKNIALLILRYQHLFLSSCQIDKMTGLGLYLDLDAYLCRISEHVKDDIFLDRLLRIYNHCHDSLIYLINNTRSILIRDHELLPLYAVKELDNSSIMWLSKQPGRTVREKAGIQQKIKAVRRHWVLNSSENKLLKAFIKQFMVLLEERLSIDSFVNQELKESFNFLQTKVSAWLIQDDVKEIAPWGNLPPNNTLLSDKYYRKIWDAWSWLQALNNNVISDYNSVQKFYYRYIFLTALSFLHSVNKVRIYQSICYFDINKLMMSFDKNEDIEQNNVFLALGKVVDGDYKVNIKLLGKNDKLILQSDIKNDFEYFNGKSYIKNNEGSLEEIENGDNVYSSILNYLEIKDCEYVKFSNFVYKGNRCICDLSFIKPKLLIDNKNDTFETNLLGQFWNKSDGTEVILDCSLSRALNINDERKLVTFSSLIHANFSQERALKASEFLVNKFREKVNTNSICVLLPDGIEEFLFSNIRRQFNLNFSKAITLPKSIGAIYSSLDNNPNIFGNEKDVFVIVCQILGCDIYLTPLMGSFKEDLKKKYKKFNGWYWVRYPTKLVANYFDKSFKKYGDFFEEFSEVFSIEDLNVLSDNLSFLKLTNNSSSLLDIVSSNEDKNSKEVILRLDREIQDLLKEIPEAKNLKNFILPCDCNVVLKNQEYQIMSPVESIEGASIISDLQESNPNVVFWKDNLPDLSIIIGGNKISLVKNVTVSPILGKAVDIPQTINPILPKGKDFYRFALERTSGSQKLRYMAELKSKTFPLESDVKCKLKMTYTYGAEDPYSLMFIPLDNLYTSCKAFEVKWVPEGEIQRESIAPPYLKSNTWDDMTSLIWKNKKGEEKKSDFIDWSKCTLNRVINGEKYYKGDSSSGIGYIENFSLKPIKDKNGYNIYFYNREYHRSVMFHETEFKKSKIFNPIKKSIYYILKPNKKNDGNFIAKDISLTMFENLKIFPIKMLWGFSRSIEDSNIDIELKGIVLNFFNSYMYLKQSNKIDTEDDKYLKQIISLMHCDAPIDFFETAIKEISNKNTNEFVAINYGYLIGDLRKNEQIELFKIVIQNIKNNIEYEFKSRFLEALSLALWRTESLVFKISKHDLEDISEVILDRLDEAITFIENYFANNKDNENEKEKYLRKISTKLELILALMRTRASKDPNINKIWDANGDFCKRGRELVQKINDLLSKGYKLDLKSFIQLDIVKPESRKNQPDILCVVDMFLSGDSGANDIKLSENEEDIE